MQINKTHLHRNVVKSDGLVNPESLGSSFEAGLQSRDIAHVQRLLTGKSKKSD